MIRGLHALLKSMLDLPGADPGRRAWANVLGGGLEVAMAGHLMFVAPDAALGQPEMQLGVFAAGRRRASCQNGSARRRRKTCFIPGRSISGDVAVAFGLANQAADDPAAAALAYFTKYLAPKSASSLRHATKAARLGFNDRVKNQARSS